MRGLDEVAETSARLAQLALKANHGQLLAFVAALVVEKPKGSNGLRSGLPAKEGFDRSMPCVELEAPLWVYFLSCLVRWYGPDSASSQSGQPIIRVDLYSE